MMTRPRLIVVVSFCVAIVLPHIAKSEPPQEPRYLIIHSDDAGMSHSANRGTIDAMEQGTVSSASIMVPCPWFKEIAEYAQAHPERDFGVHLTLTCEWDHYRWGTVTSADKVPSLLDKEGYMWGSTAEVARNAKAEEVEFELRAQIERAKHFGVPITHLDTHMGSVVCRPDLAAIYVKLGIEYDTPILFLNDLNPKLAAEYPALAAAGRLMVKKLEEHRLPLLDSIAQSYGTEQGKTRRQSYLDTLRDLPPGFSQLIIHCGYDDHELRSITNSAARRDEDRRVFSDPEVIEFIREQDIEVITWKEFRQLRNKAAKESEEAANTKVRFKLHRVGRYRGEVCDVADFNKDGKLDIVAGEFIYLAPNFDPIKIRTITTNIDDQGKGYDWDFMNAPVDVDGDGMLDVVSCSWFGKQIEWYRNTWKANEKVTTGEWPATVVHKNGNYECGDLWDVDGDGRRNEIVPTVKATVWYEVGNVGDGAQGLVRHVIDADETKHTWGVGVGDINGDGRPDVLRPSAWYEGPADPRNDPWKEHPLAVGGTEPNTAGHTPQILVYDVNHDGLNDIVTSAAHDFGIFWYEQVGNRPEPKWLRHEIDKSWSQAHSLELVDLDADGDLDLVTGKRFMAHNGKDPGGNEPPGVYWYELEQSPKVTWTRHTISFAQGIGSGLNLRVSDLDADGDLDIVVTGKWGGPVWFENLLKQK